MKKLLLSLVLLGCAAAPESPTPIESTTAPSSCKAAEVRLLELECKDSRGRLLGGPTIKGEPFRHVCEQAMENGLDLHPRCIASASSCAQVEKCQGGSK